MMVQVCIDEDGAVSVSIDSESEGDDEASRLAGLCLDDMVQRASETAIKSWFAIRADDDDVASD